MDLGLLLLGADSPNDDAGDQAGAEWMRMAADAGIPEAMHNLGLLHLRGRGVEEDGQEAARWFRRAADLGHAPSRAAAERLDR